MFRRLAPALALVLAAPACAADLPYGQQTGLSCAPQLIGETTKLVVDFPKQHGGVLAIKDPAGSYFLVSFDQPNPASAAQPPLDPNLFRTMTKVVIEPTTIRGVKMTDAAQGAVGIFDRDGIYTVYSTDNIETEDPNFDGWCTITFTR